MKHKFYFYALVLLLFNSTINSQDANDTTGIQGYLTLLKEAEKSSNARDWKSASEKWQRILVLNPTEGESWYRLGESLFQSREYEKAIPAFEQSIRIGAPPRYESAYNISKCYAAAGEKKKSLYWLQKSFDLGYRNLMGPARDSNFEKYFNETRFREITGLPLNPFRNHEEGWRFDLSLLVREIKRRAPNPFRYISEKQFDSCVALVQRKIRDLPDIQMIVEFMKLMVMVGDGHTMIYAFYERPEFQNNLPLEFYDFSDGLFITEADQRYRNLLGCRILAFDDKTVAEIRQGVDPIVNRDNELGPKVMGLMRMRTIPLLYGLGLVKNPGEVILTVEDRKGQIKKVRVQADCPISTRKLWDQFPDGWLSYFQEFKKPPPLYLSDKFTHYWFRYLPNERTVYFQYNEMADDPQLRFAHFCDSLFEFIEANNVTKLVIDMRWNHGGNSLLSPILLNKLIASKKINQAGSLYAIIGRRTYSATINLLGFLERFTKIRLIGEPTGSSPNFIGEDNPFELPYSKLMANVSDQSWQCSWPSDQRQWFNPLIDLPPSFIDFEACRDPALDIILKDKKSK